MRELTPTLRAFWTQQLATLDATQRAQALAVLKGHYGPDVERHLKSRRKAA
ncbi:hypothetical protein GCM10017784_35500 [Deinococcus indicus]|uniref:hypothetical protein n=1 Tax=Deinococcus TaxID=1298 RepID=UPI00174C075C|nr:MULTISPECIES: hypothetical protein [Deinococcus]MCD0155960.1 hypothetical protein [Deinococcus sp. 6GRE01]GHG37879.1 hypothetical protein GCM10017784_35500 [Deinococcus indicus]